MSKQTIIIFGIFVIVALVGSIFIYYYSGYADELIDKYIAKITICENITDEKNCYERDFCEGIYGPSCLECDNLEFRECKRVSSEVKKIIVREKNLCDQTDGQWYRNKLGNFCLCQKIGQDLTFDKNKGCVSR